MTRLIVQSILVTWSGAHPELPGFNPYVRQSILGGSHVAAVSRVGDVLGRSRRGGPVRRGARRITDAFGCCRINRSLTWKRSMDQPRAGNGERHRQTGQPTETPPQKNPK